MATVKIIRHRESGRQFVVARRVTHIPGRLPITDWVKMPVTVHPEGYYTINYTEPQFLISTTHTTRSKVEDELLSQTEQIGTTMRPTYEVSSRVL